MRLNPMQNIRPMHILLTLVFTCVLGTAVQAQDRQDWQSVAGLHAGDRIRLSLKTGRMDGVFQSWTPDKVTIGTVTASKDDVVRMEKYRPGAWRRRKKVAVGAAVGFGGGFVLGVGAGGCNRSSFNFCFFSREEVGVLLGATGAIIGAGIGALLPSHTK